jgi:hypothetical protein
VYFVQLFMIIHAVSSTEGKELIGINKILPEDL